LDVLLRPQVEVSDNRKSVASASLPLHSAGKNFKWPAASLVRLCLYESTIDPHREMFGRLGNRRGAVDFAIQLGLDSPAHNVRTVPCGHSR
jgi:hypothetical protein